MNKLSNYEIPLFYYDALLKRNDKHYIKWDWEKYPHLLVSGATGQGKTFAIAIVAARVSKYLEAKLVVLDYKAEDYGYARGSKNLYEYRDTLKGLENFYDEFITKLEGVNEDRTFTLLVIEELSSLLSSLERKDRERVINMISQLVFLGRSRNTHLLLSSQRP